MSQIAPPRDIGRITKHSDRNAQTSQARMAVEAVLREARIALSPRTIAQRATLDHDLTRVRRILQALRADGRIVNVGTTAMPQYRMRGTPDTPAATERLPYGCGHYDGAELRPYSGRPGAMDAFACPSRNGDQLTPYRGPRSQCVGDGQLEPFSYSRRGQE